MNAPAWLPNWKDAAAYRWQHSDDPAIAHRSLMQWRWEFIRRKADYLAAWDSRHTLPVDAILKRYGMRLMMDPALLVASAEAIVERPAVLTEFPVNADKLAALAADGYAIVAIRMTAPDCEVTRAVLDIMEPFRDQMDTSNEGRTRADKWPLYLRILDAVAAVGEDFPKIADGLSTAGKTYTDRYIKEKHKEAMELPDATMTK